MPEMVGTLRLLSSGRWAVCQPGHEPVEITSGDVFLVEVPGFGLVPTRLEFGHKQHPGVVVELPGYYSIDGFPLRDGMRAAIGSGE